MARDTSFDDITYQLLLAFVKVLAPLPGWGTIGSTGAVYPHVGLPMPMQPFPCCYCYLGGIRPEYTQGSSFRRDLVTVTLRIIGAPVTPDYAFNGEDAVNQLVTAVLNELDYRPFLQDPSNNNAPFRYLDPQQQVRVQAVGATRAFNYSDLGNFVGVEISVLVGVAFNVGRLS